MTFQSISGLSNLTNLKMTEQRQQLRLPRVRTAVLQGLVAGVVGIALGGYIVAISSLSLRWLPLLALIVICPFGLMISGNVRRVMLALIILDIPFQVDVYLGYRNEVAELGAFGGINISITTVILIILYTWWLGGLLLRLDAQPQPILQPSLPLALYLGFVLLSLLVARDRTLGLFQIFFLGQTFLLYVYLAAWVRTRQDVTFLVSTLLICLILESLIMIGVYLTGHDLDIAGISTRIESSFSRRAGGTFQSPNSAAAYLSLLLPPALGLLLTPCERRLKWMAVIALGLGTAALILTQSRGGWLALLLSGALLYAATWRWGWQSSSMRITVAAVMVLLVLIFYGAVFSRVTRDDGGRIILIDLALRIIKDNPVFGIGANNFVLLIRQYATPDIANAWLYTVHNMYLLVWAETGIGGLFAFVLFLLVTVWRGWQCGKLHDALASPVALGFMAGLAGHMVHMFLDFFSSRTEIQLLWLICGLIAAMNRIEPERKPFEGLR